MKSYIKLLSLGLLASAAASCTDLDVDLDTRYTSLPDNDIAYEGEFNGCYHYMRGWMARDFLEGVMLQGDEAMGCCFGLGNYWDDGRYGKPSFHDLNLNLWSSHIISGCTEGCTYTNKKILAYGGPDQKDPTVAPLRAIRAYYHFWMMELWGDAPIMNRTFEEGEAVDRQPRAEVAKFIESELLDVLSQVKEDGEPALSKKNDASTYGRPNYWMAAALLAKLYLNWGVYTHDITTVDMNTPNEKLNDCVYWCDEITKSGLFEVGIGYRKKFFPDNGVHIKDFIYALDVDPATQGDGCTTWYRWWGFRNEDLCSPGPHMFYGGKSLAGNWVLTKEALDRFTLPGDERNIMVLAGPQYQWDANHNPTDIPVMFYKDPEKPNTIVGQLEFIADFEFDDASIYSLGDASSPAINKNTIADGTALMNVRKGARLCKYPHRKEDWTDYNRSQANDAPIFRYADIVLMKAECLLRGATPTLGEDVASLVNQVRICAGAPTINGNFTIKDLMDERSRELITEPWRRNDLIRCGMFEDDWGQKNRYKVWDDDAHTTFHWVDRLDSEGHSVKDKNHRLMPIHRELLETNTNWQQNPGYLGI